MILHGRERLNSAPPPLRRQPSLPQGLSIETYNIRNGRGFEISQAIRVVQVGGFDLMILMETKVTVPAYCHNRLGYYMV